MVNVTLALDAGTATEMRAHPEIRWTEVARQAIQRKLRELHALDAAFEESDLSEADVGRLGREASKGLLKRLQG